MEQIILQIRINDEHSQQQKGYARFPKDYPEKRRQYLRKYAIRKAIKRIIEYTVITAGIMLFTWILLSWVDIFLHNTTPNPTYQPWNIFPIIF